MKFRVAVVCVSDRSSKGEREDLSGQAISRILCDIAETVEYICVPDDKDIISSQLIRLCGGAVQAVFTTGGTGLAPRDVTPEATIAVADKLVPGMAEAMRQKSLEITPTAMLSRAACAVRNNCLIVNLPGSPKAVEECLEAIKPVLPHAVELLCGNVNDCAR
ncbi:MAG: MogA/MoaB family molybdenum cofactor biosynthesis protein [Clostridiales bacterium]|jgi:molybdenum cofactor synthesis domain-containing protein|nr:MogA/MoaB family molybdenum cofactor biosynthesis protein [Clostridiales bacterium]